MNAFVSKFYDYLYHVCHHHELPCQLGVAALVALNQCKFFSKMAKKDPPVPVSTARGRGRPKKSDIVADK